MNVFGEMAVSVIKEIVYRCMDQSRLLWIKLAEPQGKNMFANIKGV